MFSSDLYFIRIFLLICKRNACTSGAFSSYCCIKRVESPEIKGSHIISIVGLSAYLGTQLEIKFIPHKVQYLFWPRPLRNGFSPAARPKYV